MTLARMAASCSWPGHATMVCWSALYSARSVASSDTNTVRMLDLTCSNTAVTTIAALY